MYKRVASVDGYPNKVYLGNAEGDYKERFYSNRMSFKNEGYSTDATHSKYVWEVKKKEEAQDYAIIEMVNNQICTSLFKYFQEMSVVSARKT